MRDLSSPMPRTRLGRLEVSVLGLGCMSMSHPGRDDDESRKAIRRALDAGITLLDTADKYGKGHNERLVGEAIAGRREEVVVATKVGFVGSSRDPSPIDGRPGHIHRAIDGSLQRLGTDRVDLYYLHRVDPDVPVEESIGAMAELVETGKVRCLGLSEVSAETLRRAHAVHPITAVQVEYSLMTREPELTLIPECQRLHVGVVGYSPLGIGFLTGAHRDPATAPPGSRLPKQPRMQGDELQTNQRHLARLQELAAEAGATPAQLVLAWILFQGQVVPIPGASRLEHLAENLAAVDRPISHRLLATLDREFPPGTFVGERKSSQGMRLIER
ncbi:MAG TPA: aldo/keto reductase [Acidimicrobiia bacterium]|nr:aldo/keto reductase [Acidimicrobiia bacterium]